MMKAIDDGTRPNFRCTPIEDWRIQAIKQAGGEQQDLRALCYAAEGEDREALHRFLIDYHTKKFVMLDYFGEDLEKWSPHCKTSRELKVRMQGAVWALFTAKLRPGFLAAVHVRWPHLAELFPVEEKWGQALLASGWKPVRKEPGHE